jgi:SagB-type dehydrogenase family enzyme
MECVDDRLEVIAQMDRDFGERLTFGQIHGGAFLVLFAADIAKCARVYGVRAYRFCLIEAGHLCQTFQEVGAEFELSSCPIGGFDDDLFAEISFSRWQLTLPLYILAMGHVRNKPT